MITMLRDFTRLRAETRAQMQYRDGLLAAIDRRHFAHLPSILGNGEIDRRLEDEPKFAVGFRDGQEKSFVHILLPNREYTDEGNDDQYILPMIIGLAGFFLIVGTAWWMQ